MALSDTPQSKSVSEKYMLANKLVIHPLLWQARARDVMSSTILNKFYKCLEKEFTCSPEKRFCTVDPPLAHDPQMVA